jgi:carboxypeptidase family protein
MKSVSLRIQLIAAFMMLGTIPVGAQQPSPETRNDSITGRVVNESGQPIGGVSISLDVIGGRMGQRTATDNEGNFKIQGLDGGVYRFYLYAPGYVTQMPNSASPTYRTGDKAELTMIRGAVIAGSVTNMQGEPVVNVQVRAFQVRDAEGNRTEFPYFSQPAFTDDRGYFRMWSLRPGTYVVAAGGPGQYFGSVNPFANDTLTYAPSSTRDTAAEIIARANQEMTVDIRYRGERGHSVSGKISGVAPPLSYSPSVRLIDVNTRMTAASLIVPSDKSFQVDGVSDGEYEITASAGGGQVDQVSAPPKRISVRGADVTGLELVLAPMGSIAAHVNLETDQKLNCGRRRETALRETMVTLRRARPEAKSPNPRDKSAETPDDPVSTDWSYQNVPNDKGEMRFRDLSAATYRFEIRVPAAGWYLRSLSFAKPDVNVARNGLALKLGDKISGVTIAITEGGASLRGRMMFPEGETPPANLRIYLVPTEREDADNPLRFFEDAVAGDQTFVIGNVAPGKYWLLAQPAEKVDPDHIKSPRTDNDFRAKLLKTAAGGKEISFKPCERTVDYEFRYPATKP